MFIECRLLVQVGVESGSAVSLFPKIGTPLRSYTSMIRTVIYEYYSLLNYIIKFYRIKNIFYYDVWSLCRLEQIWAWDFKAGLGINVLQSRAYEHS